MKAIYVSGKYSAPAAYARHRHIHLAWEEALRLWAIPGVYAVCPHANTMHMDGITGEGPAADYEKFILADLDLLARCDAIWMMRGWQDSKGAVRERAHAYQLGKKIFYADWHDARDVKEWLQAHSLQYADTICFEGPTS